MFPVLFFPFHLIGETLGAEAGPRGIFPRGRDYCETRAEAGMTSERPDTSLNSLFQVGRITSGFARRWSCPMNRSHTAPHSSPKVQMLIFLTDWTLVLSLNCHAASFFSRHTAPLTVQRFIKRLLLWHELNPHYFNHRWPLFMSESYGLLPTNQ